MSSSKDWIHGACNEKSGFLFKHDCANPQTAHCSQCGKPICDEHTHHLDNEPCCTLCVKQDLRQRRGERRARSDADDYDYDDPYFYGDHYYDGYGRYHHGVWGYTYYSLAQRDSSEDFTAADAESLAYEADEEFESDMSES